MPTLSTSPSIRAAKDDLRKLLRRAQAVTGQEMETLRRNIEVGARWQSPVRTGKLRASIRVRLSRAKRNNPGINATAVAYDPKTRENYAPIQHENEEFRHEVGKAHFISEPFAEEVRKFKKNLERRLRLNG